MDKVSLVKDVQIELKKSGLHINRAIITKVLTIAFHKIMDATITGEMVRIRGFANFRPAIRVFTLPRRGVRVSLMDVSMQRCYGWRRRGKLKTEAISKEEMKRKKMEKYGYETDENGAFIKNASESGKCPKCGGELSGKPPVCSKCGSEPFEETKK